jgi:hypothetical protein
MGKQLARTSYTVNSVDVPAILVNDRDMHNLDALWRACGRPKGREPFWYLESIEGKRRINAVALHFRVEAKSLTHYTGEGWWATQLVAVDYARQLNERFGVMVDQLATLAAKRLMNRGDPLFQEVRHNGKIAHSEASGVRDRFGPWLSHGEDIKHQVANARLCEAINGKAPKELRSELGLGKKDKLWDVLSPLANAVRLLALVSERPKLEAALERTTDAREMVRIVEDNARRAAEAGKQLESQ